MWSIGGMIPAMQNQNSQQETCPSASFSGENSM
jgi:hypothetical protein